MSRRRESPVHPCYPKRGEILHVNLPCINQNMRTLEPQRTTEFSSATIGHALYEGLMRYREDGSVDLGQAASLEIDSTRTIYRFKLRKNGWSDGTPVTAQHFVNTWKQILLGKIECPNVFWFYYIKNARSAREREVDIDAVGIRSPEEDIIEIELEKPVIYFLDLLACNTFFPLHPVSIQGFIPDPHSTFYPLISNGPFKLTHWIPNVEVIFEKNEFYHAVQDVPLRKIHFNYMNSEISAIDRFLDHSMDVLGRPFPCLIKHKSMRYIFQKGHFKPHLLATTTCAILNLRRFPFNRPKLRKILYCGIDRSTLLKRLTMFEEGIAKCLLPPAFFPEREKAPMSTKLDLLEARRLFKEFLKEEGLRPQDLQEHLTIQYARTELYFNLAMDLKEAWEMLFDMEIRTEQLPLTDLLGKLSQGNFSITLLTWFADYFHPASMLNRFREIDNPKNYSGWHNPQFSALLDQADNALDNKESFELCSQAEKILIQELPVIPILHGCYPVMMQKYVKNLAISPLGVINLDKIYLDENYEAGQNPLYPEREKIIELLQECIKPPIDFPIPITDLLLR